MHFLSRSTTNEILAYIGRAARLDTQLTQSAVHAYAAQCSTVQSGLSSQSREKTSTVPVLVFLEISCSQAVSLAHSMLLNE